MEKIGKYEVLGKIGEGAMGVVYKALDPLMERVVAVKTMSADLDSEPDLKTRFLREAKSAGQLSHKNIITIYDLFEEGGRVYIAMEFLDGEELKAKIARRERLPLEYKLRFMTEICEGLGHAHQREIIHRDIKPGNVHITRGGHVKILDFGLARIAASDITRTGSVMGTPNYMSPEQVRGDHIDARSDIFSVGALFYEMLTYQKPFAGSSYHQTFFKIIEQDPEPLDKVDPKIPKELSDIVMRALSKAPDKRYQSAEDLLRELKRFGKTLEGRRKEVQEETRKAVESLDRFVVENKELLRQHTELADVDESVADREQLGEVDEETDPTMRLDLTLGYLEMLEMRDRATRGREKLGAIIETLKNAGPFIQEASSLLENGQPERALQAVEKILRDIPNHREAKDLADRVREELSRRAQEEEKERQLAELLKQAQTLYRRADFEGSLSLLEQTLRLDPEHTEATSLHKKVSERVEQKKLDEEKAQQAEELFRKATIKFSEKDPAASLQLLAEALKLQPDHLGATVLREQAQQRSQEIATFEAERRRVEEALSAAREALGAGKLEQARGELKRATELDPSASGIAELEQLIGQAAAGRRAKEEKDRKVQALLKEAHSLDQSGKEEEALERLAELSALQPNFQPATDLKKKIDERRQARERAERARQDKIAANVEKARQAEKAGDLDEAVELAHKIITDEPQHREARELLERAEAARRARKETEELERKAKQLLSLAEQLASREEYSAAVSALEKGGTAVAALDEVKRAHKEYAEAERRKEEARERARLIAEHLERGKKAFDSGDYAACEQEMDRLLALSSDHSEALDYRKRAKLKLEEQRKREERARQFAETMRAANNAWASGKLELAAREVEKARALNPENAECERLAGKIERRQVELREQLERQKRAEGLEEEARLLLKKGDAERAYRAMDEAVSLWPELPGADKLQKRIEKERARATKKARVVTERAAAADDTLRPAAPTNPLMLAAAGVGLVVLGAAVWLLFFRQPSPADVASPTESDSLIPTESTPTEDPEITRGLSSARDFLAQKEFAEAARESQAVLDLSPGNAEAESILETAGESLASIQNGIEEVQGFIDTSQFEKARDALSTILDIAPSNPDVQTLLGQLNGYFKQSADAARRDMNQTKANAQKAEAASLAQDLFRAAERIEAEAQRLYGQQKFGEATGKFVEAENTYQRADAEAQEERARAARERTLAAQRQQADVARQNYQEAQSRAVEAGAETAAADGFRRAKELADQAVAKYGRGDFEGARSDLDAASEAMREAQASAGAAAESARDQLGAARMEMETAKRTAPGDPQGEAEETRARELEQQGNLRQAETAYRRAASLYQAAGRAQAEREAVLTVLKSYEIAVESKSLSALTAIWPTLGGNAEKYSSSFDYARTWAIDLQCAEVRLSGDTATVACRRSDDMVSVDGQRQTPVTNVVFVLGKSGSSWVITDLRQQ